MLDRVFIIHLTDLHLGEFASGSEDDLETNEKISHFFEFLKNFRTDHLFDAIHLVITGDLIHNYGAWVSNNPNEEKRLKLAKLTDFLEGCIAALEIPANNLVFCYGNHDKSRALYNELLKEQGIQTFNHRTAHIARREKKLFLQANPRENFDAPVISAIMKSRKSKKFSEIFINPYKLIKGCAEPKLRGKSCDLTGVKILDGIAYASFNTAWLCGEQTQATDKICTKEDCKLADCSVKDCPLKEKKGYPDDGFLTLGVGVTGDLLKTLSGHEKERIFTVGLMHHHVNSLHYTNYLPMDNSNVPLWNKAAGDCQILLVGHEHGELTPYMGANIGTYVFRAGTFLSKSDLKGYNTFNVIELDFESEKIKKKTYRNYDGGWVPFKDFDKNLDFPLRAQRQFVSHKLEINDFFLIQRERVKQNNPKLVYIQAREFIRDGYKYNASKSPFYVCDTDSLFQANTLTEYLEEHALVRAKVFAKINKMALEQPVVWIEPLELLKSNLHKRLP